MANAKPPARKQHPEIRANVLRANLHAAQAKAGSDTDADASLLHELEVHQIQLELQNEELRSAQGDLEVSRARLADLYDFAPVVYVTLDPEGRILEANLTAAAYFGVERGKLVGKFLSMIVGLADRSALQEHIRRCLTERIRVESELSFSVRQRPPVTAQMTSVPYFDVEGGVAGCKTTLTDITALKRAQEKLAFLSSASAVLASSFDYRKTLAEVARLAVPVLADICAIDLVDEVHRVARLEVACADPASAARLASWRALSPRADGNTAIGLAIRTRRPLLFPEGAAGPAASTAEAVEHEPLVRTSGARSVIVVPLVARDRVLGVITLIATGTGRSYSGSALSTASDLATHAALAIDNARLYQQAQHAIAARQDVLSFVSHDLRNPLMGILLTTDMLLRAAHGNERRKGWAQIERIRRAAEQMRLMINDLLDVASIEAGRLTVETTEHDLFGLFDDCAEVLGPIAAAKTIDLRFDRKAGDQPAPPDLRVRCDRTRVMQVLSNLVGNAIKFTPDGGSIVVSAGAAEGKALVTVQDSGPGISPTVRPHIFERFYQADETGKQGRGLGLFIARSLIEAQGGAIWVDSGAQGGARFSFTLPLAPRARVDRLPPATEPARDSRASGRSADSE